MSRLRRNPSIIFAICLVSLINCYASVQLYMHIMLAVLGDEYKSWCILVGLCSMAFSTHPPSRLSFSHRRSQGSMVARLSAAQEIPGSNRSADKFLCSSKKLLQCADFGTGCTLIAVPRSTQRCIESTRKVTIYFKHKPIPSNA